MLRMLIPRADREPGVRLVAAEPATTLHHHFARLELPPNELEFATPLAMQRPGVIRARWQRKRRAERALQRQRHRAGVGHNRGAHHHVLLAEDLEALRYCQTDQRVREYQVQHRMPVELVRAVLDECG